MLRTKKDAAEIANELITEVRNRMYHDKKHVHIFDFKNPVAVFSEKEGIFRFCDESASVTISGANVRALEKIRDSIDAYLKGKK